MSEQNFAHYEDGEFCVTKDGHRMSTFDIAKELNRKSFLEEKLATIRDDAYQKKAYLLTEHGLNGSDCKKIHAWLTSVLSE